MNIISAGFKASTKKDGTIDGRKLKREIAKRFDSQDTKDERTKNEYKEDKVRTKIWDSVIGLSYKNNSLPKAKSFDFRIECHRHSETEDYKIQFRVGGSGKRYSIIVGPADYVMPILRAMRMEQLKSSATEPLTPRALADVERICQSYGY